MDVRDLNEIERNALFALLAHLAESDEKIDPGEVLELEALGEELEVDDWHEHLMRARAQVQTREELLDLARTVERRDARELIRTLLMDLAQADGERGEEEKQLLDEVTSAWALA